MTVSSPANALPVGISCIDSDTGDTYAHNLCTPTAITTAGTSTVDIGTGHFYGFNAISLGTGMVMVAYDVTSTSTTQLTALNTATALGLQPQPAPGSIGTRYYGSLVVVTSGTMGQINALWD